MPLNVIKGTRAAPEVALREVIQMDPRVRGVFLALDHGRRRVVGAGVLCLWLVVHHAGPNQGTAALGFYFDAQIGEDCLASFLDVREVQKEGENAGAAGQEFLASVQEGKVIIEMV